MKNIIIDQVTYSNKFSKEVQADKLHLLFLQSLPGSSSSLTSALLLAVILWNHIEKTTLLAWLSVIVITSFCGFFLFVFYKWLKPDSVTILKWERPYYIVLVAGTLTWGLGGTLLMLQLSATYQPIVFAFLIGLAGGSLSAFSAITKFTMTAVISSLGPVIIFFFSKGDLISIILAIAGTLFIGSAFYFIKILSKVMHRSFLLTYVLAQAKEEAEKIAQTDALTGMNNRRAFYDFASTQIEYCRRNDHPVSILLLDIDNFKQINDNRGHDAGDKTIKEVANIIMNNVRASDFCGRIGGEEFAVLLCNTTLQNACDVAEHIRKAIFLNAIEFSNHTIQVTASIGASTGLKTIDQLLKSADMAMYQAKRLGKNRVESIDPITRNPRLKTEQKSDPHKA